MRYSGTTPMVLDGHTQHIHSMGIEYAHHSTKVLILSTILEM